MHPAGAYAPGELLFNFQDAQITESSGVAVSSYSDAVLFTNNDSGDTARFFAIGSQGQTLATFDVVGAAVDWEDMASGPGSAGGRALYLADIGDNNQARTVVTVYEVAEPVVNPLLDGQMGVLTPTAVHTLAYPGRSKNAETLLVDPASGALAIVSKEASGNSGLYLAPELIDPNVPRVLERVATIAFSTLASDAESSGGLLTTGGAISPDGTKLVIRTYDEAFEWSIPSNGSLVAAVAQTPTRVALPRTQQGEAICYSRDSSSLITTSEGQNAPAHLLRAA